MTQNKSFWQLLLPSCILLSSLLAPASIVQAAVLSNGSQTDYIADISNDGLYNWSKSKTPIRVYMAPGKGIDGYKSSYPEVLRSCFDEWSAVSHGRLNWKEVADPKDADIRVSWHSQAVEAANGTEAGRTKTFASYNTETNRGTINRAEMNLLTELPERQMTDAEVKKAYLHEVGHAFGIAGHSSDPHDIMYRAVCSQQQAELDDRDIATINHLYGQEPEQLKLSKGNDASRNVRLQDNSAGIVFGANPSTLFSRSN